MPTVLIVGKSNVGKSTLFNKLIGKRKSIVDDKEGVTRDAVSDRVSYFGKVFEIVDTCGIFEIPEDLITQKTKENTISMLKEADAAVFIVDGRKGITSEDEHLAELLRKSGIEIIFVANKAENERKYQEVLPDLYKLGFGDPIPVSAEQGKNIDILIEKIIEILENKGYDLERTVEEKEIIRVAIVGRPNAGKSSLFNAILRSERSLVTPIPGTTRDAIDELVTIKDKKYLFVDTAGFKRKSKTEYKSLDMYSTVRSIKAIEMCDVAVIVIDALEGITKQDQKIAGIAENRGKATVIVYNKWDLVSHARERVDEYMNMFYEKLYFVNYSPVIFTSAVKSSGISKLINAINDAYNALKHRVSTSAVNAVVQRMMMFTPPPRGLKIFYGTQVDIRPPTFLFFTNGRKVPEHYQNLIRRTIRENIYSFTGAPIFLKFKSHH
ncbi:ribosome biogenesis GTPase Der [Thermosipho ferrireducens]|uniref:GTPase Der n=1 Tax=Thermosipho ferrireducens TaxID=2571116 RepID=A0ABX7S574_9BACT|nr:ribosome biogenesis GTPase Der [Thermosipho ferrireducens]QTA37657.1 ribosome biogenesis GTPase Der [Thermosipho ferrireducens]